MTLIIGLKSDTSVVIGAEQEEGAGIAAKRTVNKLKLVTGDDWCVVFGAAGDSTAGENAMRRLERKLKRRRVLTDDQLQDDLDEVLKTVHTKYIDPAKNHEGIALIVGAVCGKELHLMSTVGRTSQFQDSMAYAGIGSDIAIYFLDRLHAQGDEWELTVRIAAFVVKQAKDSTRYCSGDSELYVLQTPPSPRWRSLGTREASIELENSLQDADFVTYIADKLKKINFLPHRMVGYSDEHRPEPVTDEDAEKWTAEALEKIRTGKKKAAKPSGPQTSKDQQ